MSNYTPEFSIPPTRNLSRTRANRLRTSWFIIGLTCGMICAILGQNLFYILEDGIFSKSATKNQIAQPIETAPIENPSLSDARKTAEAETTKKETTKETTEAKPTITWPREEEVTVASGDRLIDILTDEGISGKEAFNVIEGMKKTFDPRQIRIGHKIEFLLERDEKRPDDAEAAKLKKMSILLSKIKRIDVHAKPDGGYIAEKVTKPLKAKTNWGQGTINSSLYVTARKEGVPAGTIVELIRAFSYDVDFQRDIQKGDKIELLYESLSTDDGEYSEGGDVLLAKLKTKGRWIELYRYTMGNGVTMFFNKKGESIKKALLKTPIDGARISSRYGMRKHPILGYSKMHSGIDFAAPTGTPIYAAGDGTVSFAGRKGGYGNYVKVRHNSTYSTAYAHVSKFGRGIKNGKKVRQGQVIAYVGSTGRSTGPHLHYEIIKNGKHVNPSRVKFAGGETLKGKELKKFKAQMNTYQTKIAELKKAKEQKLAKNMAMVGE